MTLPRKRLSFQIDMAAQTFLLLLIILFDVVAFSIYLDYQAQAPETRFERLILAVGIAITETFTMFIAGMLTWILSLYQFYVRQYIIQPLSLFIVEDTDADPDKEEYKMGPVLWLIGAINIISLLFYFPLYIPIATTLFLQAINLLYYFHSLTEFLSKKPMNP